MELSGIAWILKQVKEWQIRKISSAREIQGKMRQNKLTEVTEKTGFAQEFDTQIEGVFWEYSRAKVASIVMRFRVNTHTVRCFSAV